MAGNKDCYLIPSEKKSLEGVLREQVEILGKFDGRKTDYIPDDLANTYRKNGVVFYRKILQKKDVVRHAKKGKLFPPKSTRHIVSRRIIRLDISLDWLSLPRNKANTLLEEVIIERYKKQQVRYYAEPVILMKY
ncbi:hypothetical protein HY570_02755 [Candidatus Micrarchaeota archaeon]|nr:hypothetical protein [Candidatus Micrarchaeota archaeon]